MPSGPGRSSRRAGLPGDFGPLGTRFSGGVDEVLDTLRAVLAAAIDAGARG